MKKILYIIAISILLSSCYTQKIVFKTRNIENIKDYSPDYFVYYLPKTQLIINLQATQIVENKGPYADYAQEFLGNLTNIIKQNRTYWQLGNIQITTKPIRDTNNIWVVNSNIVNAFNFQLTRQGFPVAINQFVKFKQQEEQIQNFSNQNIKKTDSLGLTVIDQGFKEVYDTIFKTEQYDTIQRTIPIIEKKLIKKSVREQARDLANKIFELKDNKEALLIGEGDSDYLPDGQALKEMLEGIDKLEKQYLAQFIGRRDKTIFHYKFTYVPNPTNDIVQKIICRFSPKLGILPAGDLRGDPVIIEIVSHKTTGKISNFVTEQNLLQRITGAKSQNQGIAYRIPEMVTVKIKLNNTLLAEKNMLIAQFGTVAHLPVSIFKNKTTKILFDPKLGSIISISN